MKPFIFENGKYADGTPIRFQLIEMLQEEDRVNALVGCLVKDLNSSEIYQYRDVLNLDLDFQKGIGSWAASEELSSVYDEVSSKTFKEAQYRFYHNHMTSFLIEEATNDIISELDYQIFDNDYLENFLTNSLELNFNEFNYPDKRISLEDLVSDYVIPQSAIDSMVHRIDCKDWNSSDAETYDYVIDDFLSDYGKKIFDYMQKVYQQEQTQQQSQSNYRGR